MTRTVLPRAEVEAYYRTHRRIRLTRGQAYCAGCGWEGPERDFNQHRAIALGAEKHKRTPEGRGVMAGAPEGADQ